VRCSAIKRGGERCKLEATHGSYCWSHAPEMAEARRQRARRAGKAGGNGRGSALAEVVECKRQIRSILGGLLRGQIQRDTGGVLLQGYNTLARYLDLERRIKADEDLEARIERLEEMQKENRWAG
jgi:hypothetical protein